MSRVNNRRLKAVEVERIYAARPARSRQDQTFVACTRFTQDIAAYFRINEKTVREIWNRKTWREITKPLWSDIERAADSETSSSIDPSVLSSLAPAKMRKPGRPKGSFKVIACTSVASTPLPASPISGFAWPAVSASLSLQGMHHEQRPRLRDADRRHEQSASNENARLSKEIGEAWGAAKMDVVPRVEVEIEEGLQASICTSPVGPLDGWNLDLCRTMAAQQPSWSIGDQITSQGKSARDPFWFDWKASVSQMRAHTDARLELCARKHA